MHGPPVEDAGHRRADPPSVPSVLRTRAPRSPHRSGEEPVAGRWVLLEAIGRGGCGTVHRAHDLERGLDVAAKLAHDAAARARLAHERTHVVTHPHVLPVLGWAEQGDLALLATELVHGGSLLDLVRRDGRLGETTVALLLAQLLDALAAVHAAGLVHGDVKPANLLLRDGPRPHLLLADFGVAVRQGCDTGPAARVEGTPSYLPPERLAGAAPHPGQDVYAAGLLGRRVLRGSSPLLTLCDSMARPEPWLRPSADVALRRLRELSPGRWPAAG